MPLSQLILYCPPLLQLVTADSRGAWAELQRRALAEQNHAAWDALLIRLWSSVLFWIYERTPEMAPAMAERLAQRTISEFKRRQMRTAHHPAALPSHEMLLADLQQLVELLLAE